ncbi:methylmalonyl Co-A mutase-associated GTPase MeaB [Vulgatibacter incomptus]|uniref:Putative periplasmic protein kinase ArgK n=1 Tax=Vulgatibacter incomptus TaxID=1391653 RepID=A0A0K1P8L4_9BACT|nr:methylmalonyl Co-A mutase-associated GTPase MeaB [Vulgatibacter incomptus]AKU89746.1 putative periplasmic protein kinase ArgK [Vulgatibacter incomptus]
MDGIMRRRLSEDDYVQGVVAGDRTILARAITLVESTHPAHEALGQAVLARLLPRAGRAVRVGVSGVPGVGKSTFIDAFGTHLTGEGHEVAVLAVDPSSTVTGGSILGDKTRMQRLSVDPHAFIRPSPSAGSLGGVARRTREASLLCEAAGFDVILIETVGVGQSETSVAGMVDFFLVLMLAGAGDELQGIKKGILELADLIAINKADGPNAERARRAAREYQGALHYVRQASPSWAPRVLTCSAREDQGLDAIWKAILEHRDALSATGELAEKRRAQQLRWMWSMVEEGLLDALRKAPGMSERLSRLERAVLEAHATPSQAAGEILGAFRTGG